jgi:pyrophosphatase PpaX
MKFKDTVLFDFDGTIMDTNDVIIKSWDHTFETLGYDKKDHKELIVTFGEPLELTLEKFFPDIPVEESIEIYRGYQRDHFVGLISLFPGVVEMLDELKAKGIKMALVTSRLHKTTMDGVEKFGLGKYFEVIITADDTSKHKPDPEPILITLDKLGSKPENAIMVGDTLFDIRCARNATVESVLVSWSMALHGMTKESLGENAPDWIIDKPDEILEIIKK